MAVRITCINKSPGKHENPYLAISGFGWINDGSREGGYSTRVDMYNFVVNKKGYAFVRDKLGNNAYLVGAKSDKGTPYLKSVTDESDTDELFSLPDCGR